VAAALPGFELRLLTGDALDVRDVLAVGIAFVLPEGDAGVVLFGSDEAVDAGADEAVDAGADEAVDAGADEAVDAGADEAADAGADEAMDAAVDDSAVFRLGLLVAQSVRCGIGVLVALLAVLAGLVVELAGALAVPVLPLWLVDGLALSLGLAVKSALMLCEGGLAELAGAVLGLVGGVAGLDFGERAVVELTAAFRFFEHDEIGPGLVILVGAAPPAVGPLLDGLEGPELAELAAVFDEVVLDSMDWSTAWRSGGTDARTTPTANTAIPTARAGRSIAWCQSRGRCGARRPGPRAALRSERTACPPRHAFQRRTRSARNPEIASRAAAAVGWLA
jgi:hypothetical protein